MANVAETGGTGLTTGAPVPTTAAPNTAIPTNTGTAYATPIPNLSSYGTAGVMAMGAYNKAVAQLNQQRQQLLTSYGYKGMVDPSTGGVSNVAVDPYNATGQYQQMLNSDALASMQADQTEAGNNVIGGLAHQPQQALQYQHAINSSNLGNGLLQTLYSLANQQSSAADTAYNTAWQQAQMEMQNALMAGMFNPADMSGLDWSGGGDNTDTPKDKAPPASKPAPIPAAVQKAIATARPGGVSSNKKQGVYSIH